MLADPKVKLCGSTLNRAGVQRFDLLSDQAVGIVPSVEVGDLG